MKKATLKHSITASITLLLLLPACYFITSAILHYVFGISQGWQLIQPVFLHPENKSLGININLLIVFGPIASCIISLFQIMHLEISKEDEMLHIKTSFVTKSYYWVIIAVSLLVTGCILLYFLSENCNCH